MRRFLSASLLLAVLLSVSLASAFELQGDISYEAGYVEWIIEPSERLYVEGMDVSEAVLQRGFPDAAVGTFTTPVTNGPIDVFTLQSQPLEFDFEETEVNITVWFSVSITANTGPQTCTRQTLNDASTTLWYTVTASGTPIYNSEYTATVDAVSSGESHNFSGERQQLTLQMNKGDTFGLNVRVDHNCVGSQANVHWGGFEQNSGGILIEGELYEPVATVYADEQRRAHIQVDPQFPWGESDVKEIEWELWGPLPDDELFGIDSDLMQENSANRVMMERKIEDNRTAWVWTGAEKLDHGLTNLELCIKTISGNLNSDCHARGVVKFDVEQRDQGMASAAVWLSVSSVIIFFGYILNAYRTGLLLPIPIIASLLILSLLMVPTAFDQANLGAGTVKDDAAVYEKTMSDFNGQEYQIADLLEGKKALIVGVILPGSENGLDQANELNSTLDNLGEDIAVVQIVAGEDAMISDVQYYVNQLNVSWPILFDQDNTFSESITTGISDAIVIIDPAKHVTWHQSPSAGSVDIIAAVEEINTGGSQSITSYFSLILGPGLFLLFLALPREGWTKPEEVIMPGSLWLSTIVASGLGMLMINLIPMIAAFLPVANISFYVEIIMYSWLVLTCLVTARRGQPVEAEFLGKLIHSKTSEAFQNWRPLEDLQRDVLLGVWFGWFGYFTFPSILSQGTSASILSGGSGIAIGLLFILGVVLLGGMSVLFLRFIASWGGPFSRMFGKYGANVFAKYVGIALLPFAIWNFVNAVLLNMELGIF